MPYNIMKKYICIDERNNHDVYNDLLGATNYLNMVYRRVQSAQMKLSGSKIVISFFLFVLSPCGFFCLIAMCLLIYHANFTYLDIKLLSWQDF
jgi:hypothetical protein